VSAKKKYFRIVLLRENTLSNRESLPNLNDLFSHGIEKAHSWNGGEEQREQSARTGL